MCGGGVEFVDFGPCGGVTTTVDCKITKIKASPIWQWSELRFGGGRCYSHDKVLRCGSTMADDRGRLRGGGGSILAAGQSGLRHFSAISSSRSFLLIFEQILTSMTV